jgi:hypothetical protein
MVVPVKARRLGIWPSAATETAMRRTNKGSQAIDQQYPADARPRRIPGATITSWHGAPEIDPDAMSGVDALFGVQANGATVAGAAPANANRPSNGTVSMSDGESITFVSPSQFETVVRV